MDMSNSKPLAGIRQARDDQVKPLAQQGRVGPSNKTEAAGQDSMTDDSLGNAEGQKDKAGETASQPSTANQSSLILLMEQLSGTVESGNTRLAIEVDYNSMQPRFLLLHKQTGEVLRLIPEKEFLPLLRELTQKAGVLVDKRV